MEIAYFPGCTLHASSQLYDLQCRLVLQHLGVKLVELDDWNCCGATSASKTDDFLAVALPGRNLSIADSTGPGQIVIPCSACYSRMLIAQQRLLSDQALRLEINGQLNHPVTGKTEIISIIDLLVSLIGSPQWQKTTRKRLHSLKPVCYYGCMQTRFPFDIAISDNVENPQGMETVLKALGATPLHWSHKTDCCGASASVNDSALSLRLMARILEDAVSRDAHCLVTSCPMCQLNLDAYQDPVRKAHGIKERLPVYLITELVGVTMEIPPADLRIDRHFVDAIPHLKELPLL